jgi:hypothetical protein
VVVEVLSSPILLASLVLVASSSSILFDLDTLRSILALSSFSPFADVGTSFEKSKSTPS